MAAPAMSYSVWLKPPPDSAFGRRLHSLIIEHAAALPGCPPFAPHVTLLGGFTAASDVRAQRRRVPQRGRADDGTGVCRAGGCAQRDAQPG